jgi:DNA polymerase III epsilon subunit-like protein
MPPVDHLPLHEVTFCVLDLETTGTDPGWDDITEIGAILVRGGERLGTFHTLVGPAEIDAFLPSLCDFLQGAVLTGHNIGFDVRFLNAALARSERPLLDPDAVVDTMWLARALLRDEVDDCRLGTLAQRYDFANRPCHRAFEDAAATVDLLHLLIERAWSFGATALDDLRFLPSLAGHRWAAKLRHTASMPRSPGTFVCHDREGRAVWVATADELRREVRAMFTRAGSAGQSSVLRDTERWEVFEIASPLGRQIARERLLHLHRPRLQRSVTLGHHAAYVALSAGRQGWRATATRRPAPTAVVLGPVPTRAEASAAAAALQRLAAHGIPFADVLESVSSGRVPPCLDPAPGVDDPVAEAVARRDRAAMERLVQMHTSICATRARGLHDEPGLPAPAVPLPNDQEPLPLDLLSEVLLLADRVTRPSSMGSGDGAEAHRHGVQTEHEVATAPRQGVVGGELEVVETPEQFLEQHA